MEKIPVVVLTASLSRNPDERLQALADELNERYGGSWLIPVFMKAIISQPKKQVYETYSSLMDTPKKGYLFTALGMLDYRCYPDDWTFERSGPDGLLALIFWGDYRYGAYDIGFVFERYVDPDERWLFDLAKDPEGRKPTVTWQTYNRGGVLYESYDERLGIPQSRFIKCTLSSIQEAYTQIVTGSRDNKMGPILSTDQAGGSLSFTAP